MQLNNKKEKAWRIRMILITMFSVIRKIRENHLRVSEWEKKKNLIVERQREEKNIHNESPNLYCLIQDLSNENSKQTNKSRNLIENRKIKEKLEKKKKKTGSATSSLTHRTRTPAPISTDRSRGSRHEHPANSTKAPNLLNPSNPNQVIIRKFEQKIKKSKGTKTRENREEVTAGEK
jgi:hypothetical protein